MSVVLLVWAPLRSEEAIQTIVGVENGTFIKESEVEQHHMYQEASKGVVLTGRRGALIL